MFKRLLKAGMTVALLWGCYVAYGRGFDMVVQHFRAYRSKERSIWVNRPSKSKQRATKLAQDAFGPNHWTVTHDQPYVYYSSERGFWMYALDVEEIQEENGVRYDGKRLKMKPVAMIFESKDGRKHQTVTADHATVDLSQPLGLSSKQGNDAMRIVHALIEGDVRIRDNHGTPSNPLDDTNIGPMTHLVFDEDKHQFTTESQVVMRDSEQTTTGEGMLVQLRKKASIDNVAGQASTGFEGAEYLILFKNPRVTMRDVGNSGVMPGTSPTRKNQKSAAVNVQTGNGGSTGKKDTSTEPSPLIITSDGPMRVDFAKEVIPVLVGPPEPPAPTKVKFERNVVALQTHPGRLPDQLNCDSLKLTLVPSEKPPTQPKSTEAGSTQAEISTATTHAPADSVAKTVAADSEVAPDPEILAAVAGAMVRLDPAAINNNASDGSGAFGNLTLQKAHATGHAVWLQLREQGATVLCNQLIHDRRAPYHPDMTYFGGDSTRGIWLQKIDREPVEPEDEKTASVDGDPSVSSTDPLVKGNLPAKKPRQGKITGVTHVRTIDATLYDMGGNGMDLSDIVARGPGKLETRPDFKEPVERVAVWQDELTIQNVLGPESQLLQKKITLTGSRPYFVDTVKKASVDSAELIYLWLKPKTATKTGAASPVGGPGTVLATSPTSPAVDAFAEPENATSSPPANDGKSKSATIADVGGSGLQIERLQAFRDAHFLAPEKRMEARDVLDASFVEAEPVVQVASNTPASGDDTTSTDGPDDGPPAEAPPVSEPTKVEGQAPSTVVAQDAPEKPPAMTGVADRIWAKVALKPGSEFEAGSNRKRTAKTTKPEVAPVTTVGSAKATAPGSGDADTDIREAWLWGNVTLHQESPPEKPVNPDGSKAKPKTQDVNGEAVYMDNYRGKGKMLARVYHRDPNGPARPGPWPLATVASDDKTIRSTLIRTDQEHDKVWCDGPGELTQLTERSLFTDKKSEPKPEADGSSSDAADPGSMADAPEAGNRIRTSANTAKPSALAKESSTTTNPKTRGGRPITDKDLLTITWKDRMEFTGRAKDPTPAHHPAGKAEFFGSPNATMEDAQLKCTERMIVYTDREMPLGELGAMSQGSGKSGAPTEGKDAGDKEETPVDISLIYCFGKSVAVTRKLDPDIPIILEQHIIYAEQRLDYNRRTGEFIVPGAGEFYKYERSNESEKTSSGDGSTDVSAKKPKTLTGQPNTGRSTASRRNVTPTSGRTASSNSLAGRSTASPMNGEKVTTSPDVTPPISRKIAPLVLTQVFFTRGLQGQFGTSQDSTATQDRTAVLFGDIQLRHAQVNSVGEAFDFDQPLTEDGFYLTSQILRLIQEPRPPGAPESTPARSFLKAWDNVTVNKGQSMVISSDVGTYDSGTDQLYAYGEGDRGVVMVEQPAAGQPGSPAHGKALQFNVKSGAAHFVNSDVVQLFDKRTGTRPDHVGPPDPNVKKPKKRGTPFMVPNNNLERRGFTGQ